MKPRSPYPKFNIRFGASSYKERCRRCGAPFYTPRALDIHERGCLAAKGESDRK